MKPQKKPEKSMPNEKAHAVASPAVIKILEDEIRYWEEQLKCSDNSYVVHGGLTEVIMFARVPHLVTRDYLLERYKEIRDRKIECATYDLCVTSKERDQKRMEAIKRIGEKIKTIG